MKNLRYILIPLVLIVAFASCKKPECEEQESTVTLKFDAQVNGNPFALNNVYTDVNSYRYEPQLLKLYLSNISLLKADGSSLLIKDVVLLDWQENALGELETIILGAEPGNYTGIEFWIGVDSVLNNQGVVTDNNDHPLSTNQGTYWAWNTGFRFLMYEGYYDSIPNGTGTVPRSNAFNYHCGTNPLYMKADLTNAQQAFSLTENGGNYDYELVFDINKIWYSSNDTIHPNNMADQSTHTTSNFSLAQRIIQNTSKAFSLP